MTCQFLTLKFVLNRCLYHFVHFSNLGAAHSTGVYRLFAVWVILLAMGVFSSFISSITATVSLLSNSQLLDTFASGFLWEEMHWKGAAWHGFGLDYVVKDGETPWKTSPLKDGCQRFFYRKPSLDLHISSCVNSLSQVFSRIIHPNRTLSPHEKRRWDMWHVPVFIGASRKLTCVCLNVVVKRKHRKTHDDQQKSQQEKHVERAEVLFAPRKLSNSKNELRCCASSASATFQRISMERFQETGTGKVSGSCVPLDGTKIRV